MQIDAERWRRLVAEEDDARSDLRNLSFRLREQQEMWLGRAPSVSALRQSVSFTPVSRPILQLK